eukprot:1924422-Amphidinium_carterae.1
MATSGMRMTEGGVFKPIELKLKAPPDHDTWRAAFKVLRTVLVALGAVSPGRLDRYMDHIHGMARLYPEPPKLTNHLSQEF